MLLDLSLAALLLTVTFERIATYRHSDNLREWARKINSYFLPPGRPSGGNLLPLFFVSVSSLYLEIMLIRWIGTEVRIFAFFQNLALIACFLGFGLGCYWSRRRKSLPLSLAATTALVIMAQAPLDRWKNFLRLFSALLSLSPDADLWGYEPVIRNLHGEGIVMMTALPIIAVAVFLLLLVAVMIPLGQWVGYYLDQARDPVGAYSINLLGSVAGIWVFAGMAFLWLPPEYWFGVACLLLLIIRPSSLRFGVAALAVLALSVVLLRLPRASKFETHWSPYQKLEVVGLGERQYSINVNNT